MSSSTREVEYGGLAMCLQHLYGFLDGVAVRCALELNIPDIINNHDGRITLAQIASEINSSSLNINGLSRLMTFLVYRRIFDQVLDQPGCEEPLYTSSPCSKWLLQDPKTTIAPFAMLITDPLLFSPFYNLSKSISEGGTTWFETYGNNFWGFLADNPHASKIFYEGMASKSRITMDAVLKNYNFNVMKGTLVDVAGGIGAAINAIVAAHPHLKGINFDLPHVISAAPPYQGVTHVEGDMFKAIPPADSILLKSVLHNWSDNECVQILKNCRDSINAKTGKVIIVDVILHPGGDDVFEYTRIFQDMLMLVNHERGKERTETEWKKILEEAGYHRYNVIQIPTIESIIEAYLD